MDTNNQEEICGTGNNFKTGQIENNKTVKGDLEDLANIRNKNKNNPLIGYLNINSLKKKIVSLRGILEKTPIDILCIDEIKLDESFPDQQFQIQGYQYPPFRKDRDRNGGGKMVFIRQGLIVKRLQELEMKKESICIELTISKKKWCILFVYRPPHQDKASFFNEITLCASKIVNKYDNFLIAGDLNIDFLDFKKSSTSFLTQFIDTLSLSNLVKENNLF